ncbi:twin-arginine translocase subunit TatC [Brachybacterium hainanense]|uniref:Sec-independent protein translocase protein TatC n=1 Tax=Brachybacterium hainanense TaxID=1541174 RepID=A0ABV6RBE0_9MICO
MASSSQPMDKAAKAGKPKRRKRDPEGRMALGEHLTELRNRLLWCAGTVLVTAVIGWFLYDWVFSFLAAPFRRANDLGIDAQVNFGTAVNPFSIKLQISAYIGLILAAPMFLYQVWAFIMPGLHKNERRYALGFFGSAIPLFVIGCLLGYFVVDKAIPILLSFAPKNSDVSQIIEFDVYLKLFVKTTLAFGIAFIMPVVLVLLNFLGILPGKTMLKAWRWVTFLCFAFTAVMVPTPDPFTMTFMALPMVGLYFAAVLIGILHDRRKKGGDEDELDDDVASTIDDAPEAIDGPSSLDEDDDEPRSPRR